MSLSPGTRLGPYEVVALIGAGGMGEVYQATDTRLGRSVAIKILPPELSADADRRARFEREARTVGALSHPNIVAIHDVGTVDDVTFLVMELLEGETLRARLADDLPVRKALDIACQVARGLAAAHDKHVVHRDLKPENIFLLADGRVKVLDFGLARPTSAGSGATETVAAATDPGTVMGTVGYMAPEQVRGQTVDARTDLFALGAVLYEMLTGQRAFRGETSAETMTAILREDPPELTAARAGLSPALDRIVRHCLEKVPAERFQSARDVAFALEALSGSGTLGVGAAGDAVETPRRGWRALGVVAIAWLALLAAAFAVGAWWSTPKTEWAREWVAEDLGGSPIAVAPRVSPNGDVAFLAMIDNLTQVAVVKPGTGIWQALTTDRSRGGAGGLSWSNDGTKIFFDRIVEYPRGVFSIPLPSGAESLILGDASVPRELPGGDLLVTRINADRLPQLHRLRRGSQTPEPLNAILAAIFSTHRVFPDGREAVFFGRPLDAAGAANHLHAIDLATGRTRRLAPTAPIVWSQTLTDFPLAVTPDGRWVVFDLVSGDLHRIVAAPRDGSNRLETLFTVTAEPINIDIGADGTVYIDQVRLRTGVTRVSPENQRLEFEEVANMAGAVLALPGGRALTTERTGGRHRLVVVAPGKPPQPFAPTIDEETRWPMAMIGPDRVAYLAGAAGSRSVAIASIANGLVSHRLARVNGNDVTALAGSPDGKTVYYVAAGVVWAIPSGDGEPRRIRAGDSIAVDPNGQYLVIKLNEKDGVRLVRHAVPGGDETEIPIRTNAGVRLVGMEALAPNALSRDGRIAVRVASSHSWYWPAAILDPRTGQITPLNNEWGSDVYSPGWSDDGRVVMNASTIQSRIWRFRPVRP